MNAIREPLERMGGELEIEHWKPAFRNGCRSLPIAL